MTYADDFKVAIIGAGFGGIATAIALRRSGMQNFTILERSDGVGGTWHLNRYPGAACDVESHLYSYSFNMKRDWSRVYARQPEIRKYIEDTVDKFDIRRHVRFNTEVRQMEWDEAGAVWHLTTGTGERMTYSAVVCATGLLNDPNVPRLPGMETYKGKMFHTARWQDVDLAGRTVAIIGTGSSAAQVVPAIAPDVKHLYVVQRQPGWVLPNQDRAYSEDERERMARNPLLLRLQRYRIYWKRELGATIIRAGSRIHRLRTKQSLDWLGSVTDEGTRQRLTPDYPYNCKRPVRDPRYYLAFNRSNVELVPHAAVRLTEDGFTASDGIERQADVIVTATGFKAAEFLSTVKILGREGVDLKDEWRRVSGPEAFLGMTVSGFPNMFVMYGPNTNSASNSIVFVLECQADYIANAILSMRRKGVRALELKSEVQQRFNSWLQRKMPSTTWTAACNNYYASAQGKLVTNWPHTSLLYWLMTRVFRVGFPGLYRKTRASSDARRPAEEPPGHMTAGSSSRTA